MVDDLKVGPFPGLLDLTCDFRGISASLLINEHIAEEGAAVFEGGGIEHRKAETREFERLR
jgi:hypothetical protein